VGVDDARLLALRDECCAPRSKNRESWCATSSVVDRHGLVALRVATLWSLAAIPNPSTRFTVPQNDVGEPELDFGGMLGGVLRLDANTGC
jgi:hypothetical protein